MKHLMWDLATLATLHYIGFTSGYAHTSPNPRPMLNPNSDPGPDLDLVPCTSMADIPPCIPNSDPGPDLDLVPCTSGNAIRGTGGLACSTGLALTLALTPVR